MYIIIELIVVLVLSLVIRTDYANAQISQETSGLPLPRFVSLRSDEIRMRTGPGVRYPIDWVYKRRNMPMEVIAEFRTWRKVRDFQGIEGWMHQSMLSNKRSLTVTGQTRTLRNSSDSKTAAIARIEPGVIGEIVRCERNSGWCKLSIGKFEGWLRRVEFWGVYSAETIK